MAINFPASPNNGQIHTASNIQWKWDSTGGTWLCQGSTGIFTLGIASANSLGGIKIGNNLNIDSTTGTLDAVMNLNNESISELTDVTFNSVTLDGSNGGGKVLAWDQSLQAFAPVAQSGGGGGGATVIDDLTDVTITSPSSGQVLKYNGSAWINDTDATGGGGGSGLQSRTSANAATSASHAVDTAENIQITAAKTYVLHKIQTSHAAWVTLYVSDAARVADSSRTEEQDPNPGSGVIAEIITSDGAIQNITPGTIGWNDEATPTTVAFLKVVNKSGSTQPITVTLHFVALEA